MTNLEPRAKIGDVVIARKRKDRDHPEIDFELQQYKIAEGHYVKFKKKEDGEYWAFLSEEEETIFNEDILKNLTTGKEYGNE